MYSLLTRHPALVTHALRRNPPGLWALASHFSRDSTAPSSRKSKTSRVRRVIAETNPGIETFSRENPHLNPQSHGDLLRAEIRDVQPEKPRSLTVGVLGKII